MYRKPDTQSEIDNLRSAYQLKIDKLQAEIDKRKADDVANIAARTAWTNDQREHAEMVTWVLGVITGIVTLVFGIGMFSDKRYVLGAFLETVTAGLLWAAIRFAAGHWAWWKGLGHEE